MTKWYLITPECSAGMQNGDGDVDGMYFDRRILPVGCVIPLEWKGRQRIQDLYLPAGHLQEYEPNDSDWPILYMLWGAVRPYGIKFPIVDNPRIGSPQKWASGWYQISAPDPRKGLSSVPYGVMALCDVEGICKAGDVAMVGDIVPAPFFAGLDAEQFDRLETIGLCSQSWLNAFEPHYRAEYMKHLASPVMERYHASPYEKDKLFEKFPAMRPPSISEVVEVPNVSRKRKV